MADSTTPRAAGTQPPAAAPAANHLDTPIRHINIMNKPCSVNVTRGGPDGHVAGTIYPEGHRPMPADGITEIMLTPRQARPFVAMKMLRAETAEAGEKRRKAGVRATATAKPGSMGGGAAPLYPPNSPEAREAEEAAAAAAAERAARQG